MQRLDVWLHKVPLSGCKEMSTAVRGLTPSRWDDVAVKLG